MFVRLSFTAEELRKALSEYLRRSFPAAENGSIEKLMLVDARKVDPETLETRAGQHRSGAIIEVPIHSSLVVEAVFSAGPQDEEDAAAGRRLRLPEPSDAIPPNP